MKTVFRVEWKPLLLALVPALLILSGAGVIAVPNFRELDQLQAQRSRIDAALAEAERVRPFIESFRSHGEANAQLVHHWLDLTFPDDGDPRIFMSDVFLASLASGVRILRLRSAGEGGATTQEEDGTSSEPKGTVWMLEMEGSYSEITAFVDELRAADAVYVPQSFDIGAGRDTALRGRLRLLVPWLPAESFVTEGAAR